MEKVNDTTVREVIPQEDIVLEKTLDEYLAEEANLIQGIVNNETQIVFMQGELTKLRKKITDAKALGVKTEAESKPIVEEVMEEVKETPSEEVIEE